MKEVLFIDDQPSRYAALHPQVHKLARITFAHGFDQINHYLNWSDIKWDLILLDMDMPLFSGRDVSKCFLRDCKIPIIIVSLNTYASEWVYRDLLDWGVEVYYHQITEDDGAIDINKKAIELLERN